MAHNPPEAFEEFLLHAYPNPGRDGCPGDEVIKKLAAKELPIDHPAVMHVGRCSPCYREFRAFQEKLSRRRALVRIGALAVVIAALSCLSTYFYLRQPWRDNQVREANVNLQEHPLFRGAGESAEPPQPIFLPRGKLDLHIRLPVASESGAYEVEFMKPGSSSPVAKGSGDAYIVGNQPELHVRADAPLHPGVYTMGVRRIPLKWQTYEVIVGER
jgi:hypothetical protein